MKEQFIAKEDLRRWIEALSDDYQVFCLTEDLLYRKVAKGNGLPELNPDRIRAVTPLKAFYFRQVERVDVDPDEKKEQKKIVFGVKQCDLQARKVLDKMFLEGVEVEPFYQVQYENTILFSSDCPEPGNNCFCTFINGKPYASEGFDLNFSTVDAGCVIEPGGARGEALLGRAKGYLKEATAEQLQARTKKRELAVKKLDEINQKFSKMKNINFEKLLEEQFNSETWKEKSKSCVQCAGCNMICPSCYCFFISLKSDLKRRCWDGCHFTSYARVAGGHNPRPKVFERFRNRYECKLNWRMKALGLYGCTGCGRCFSVAPCKIDIRSTVSGLMK